MKTNTSKEFNDIVKEMFDLIVKRNPDFASALGLHEYDDKLPEETRKKYLEEIEIMKKYLQRFQKIDSKKLSEENKLDKEIIIHQLKLGIFSSETLRMWESNPDIMDSLGASLFVLLIRDFAPLEKRMKSIVRRLEKMPQAIEEAKTRIIKPYKLWTNIAIESCGSLIVFLKSLLTIPLNKSLKTVLEKNVEMAIKSINEYKAFLEKEIMPKTIDRYTIGKNNFEKLIELRELGLKKNLKTNEILDLGYQYLDKNKNTLKDIAQRIDPRASVDSVRKSIEDKHPKNFKEILKRYAIDVEKAKKFIIENKLMDMPKNEKIVIEETPPFLRHTTPFAAYFAPAKFDKVQTGIYIVTPHEKTMNHHNYASISNVSTHEAYPGHHLQLSCANKNPSLVRTLSDATETVEGWAFYCEEYMKNEGFETTDEAFFIQTLDMIWRSARIIIDIKLHRDEMTFDQAVNFLVEQTGMQKPHAIAEVKRYTKAPSYQLSYMLGKHLIKELKKEVKEKVKQAGKKYSDRFFHDTILHAGSIPIKYLYKEFILKIEKM